MGANVGSPPRNEKPNTVFEIELMVAGVLVRVVVEGACQPTHIEARFGRFRRAVSSEPPRAPAASLRVRVVEGWRPPRMPTVPYPGAEGEERPDGVVHFLRAWESFTWDTRTRHGEVMRAHLPQSHAPIVDPTPIDTPLRLLLSHDLPRHEGLLVHASGYGDARGAVVFMAPTGGGKTTTARKLPEGAVLSDDQVALRRVDGRWYAHALPFVGEYAKATSPRVTPLRALVLLEKGPSFAAARVSSGRALARVMHCTVRFVRGGDASGLLALVGDVVEKVPVYALSLSLGDPVMPFIEERLR